MRISDWSSDVCSSDLLIGCVQCAGTGQHRDLLTAVENVGRMLQCLGRRHRMRRGIADARIIVAMCPRRAGYGVHHLHVVRHDDAGHGAFRGGDTQGAVDHVTRLRWRSEEHTSELQSLMRISYAVFCLKKKKNVNG